MNRDQDEMKPRIRWVRFAYGLLTAIYLACVIVQVLLAGLGVFVSPDDLQWHRMFANYFENLSVLLFLLSFAGRIRGSLRWLTLALFAITSLQHMSVNLPGALPAIHTVDALLLFWIALHMTKRSWPWLLLRGARRDRSASA